MNGLIRGSAAIIGAAESDIGSVAALLSPIDLMAQGIQRALEDCGLSLSDVDGVFCATSQARTSAMSLVEYLGMPDVYTDSTIVGGSSFEVHVAHAQAALAAGLCKVAVVAYGSTQRTVGRRGSSPREFNAYETPYKPFLPATAYAMAAHRHMHEFGTKREHLAEVAVAARDWALTNPVAWEKKPLTIEDVINARPISDPFTVRDICLVTDGGGAIVMTTAERAKSIDFSYAYLDSPHKIIVRRDAKLTSMFQFADRTLALNKGASVDDELKAAVPTIKLVNFDNYDLCFAAVKDRKVDGFLADQVLLLAMAEKAGAADFMLVPDYDGPRTSGFGLPKNEPRFKDFVNATLLDLEASGEAEKIFAKWFSGAKRTFRIAPDKPGTF